MPIEKANKRKSLSWYKKKAWDSFSIYIRTRDCLRFTGDPEQGKCVTCNINFPFKKLQAGHFIDGRSGSVLFDERIVYSQCYQCNSKNESYGGKSGNKIEYFVFMEKEWGRDMIDEFRALKNKTVKYKWFDYERIEQEFKEKTKALFL